MCCVERHHGERGTPTRDEARLVRVRVRAKARTRARAKVRARSRARSRARARARARVRLWVSRLQHEQRALVAVLAQAPEAA